MATEEKKSGRIDAPNTPKAQLARIQKEKEKIEDDPSSAGKRAGVSTARKKSGRIDAPSTAKGQLASLEMERERIEEEILESGDGAPGDAGRTIARRPSDAGSGGATEEKTDAAGKIEGKLEELRKLVLENRDAILGILEDASGKVLDSDRVWDNPVNDALRKGAGRAEEMARETFRAITSKEVQTHFVRMGLEFFMGMEALIKALPLPRVMEDAYGEVDAAAGRLGETVCENNPDCLYRGRKGSASERVPDKGVRPTVRHADSPVREPDAAQPSGETAVPTRNVRRERPRTGDGLEKIELG